MYQYKVQLYIHTRDVPVIHLVLGICRVGYVTTLCYSDSVK